MTESVQIRPALESEASAVHAVEQACREAPHWKLDQYQAILRSAAAKAAHMKQLLVAEMSETGQIAGFAVMSCLGPEAELESVAVLTDFRRRGIGKALCRGAMQWAADAGAETMWLEVRCSSSGAQALYSALGFVATGTRRSYYRDPVEDATLMSVHLP